jgi:uncharacterized protein DUF1996
VKGRLGLMVAVLAAAGGALLVLPERVAGREEAAAAFPGGPYYVIGCGFSHRSNDDPIMWPNQPGKSHNHTFLGNRTTDASTTPADLRGGPTSCGDDGDASAYWVPTLFDGSTPIRPLVALAYYVKRTFEPIHILPANLRMLAGDPMATRRQATTNVWWTCGGVGATGKSAVPRACTGGRPLQMRVDFPNCWNGDAVDSADHKRHMAYSVAGRCPASHPVPMPAIVLIVLYPPVSANARPSAGRFAVHADFMNGWDANVLGGQVAALNRSRPPDG